MNQQNKDDSTAEQQAQGNNNNLALHSSASQAHPQSESRKRSARVDQPMQISSKTPEVTRTVAKVKRSNISQQQMQFRQGVYGVSSQQQAHGQNAQPSNQNVEEEGDYDGSTGGSAEDPVPITAPISQQQIRQANKRQPPYHQQMDQRLQQRNQNLEPYAQPVQGPHQANNQAMTKTPRNPSTGRNGQGALIPKDAVQAQQNQRAQSTQRPLHHSQHSEQGAPPGVKIDTKQPQFYNRFNVSPNKKSQQQHSQQQYMQVPPIQKAQQQPQQQQQAPVAAQATTQLLKKELYFSPEILQELKRACRFGKEPIPPQYAVIPRQLPEHRGRKTLVLDLDETLIHSKFSLAQVQACRARGKPDFQMRIVVEGRPIQVYVLIRPGVQFFLQRLAQMYELVIYTASMSIYANPLVDTIDPDKHIPFRLFRDHCFSYQGSYIKDLSLLGRPMHEVIIVDNSPNAYYFHPENAVPILSWYDDPDDRCLFEMIPLLEALSQVDDVRSVIPQFVNKEVALVDFPKAAQVLNDTLKQQLSDSGSGSHNVSNSQQNDNINNNNHNYTNAPTAPSNNNNALSASGPNSAATSSGPDRRASTISGQLNKRRKSSALQQQNNLQVNQNDVEMGRPNSVRTEPVSTNQHLGSATPNAQDQPQRPLTEKSDFANDKPREAFDSNEMGPVLKRHVDHDQQKNQNSDNKDAPVYRLVKPRQPSGLRQKTPLSSQNQYPRQQSTERNGGQQYQQDERAQLQNQNMKNLQIKTNTQDMVGTYDHSVGTYVRTATNQQNVVNEGIPHHSGKQSSGGQQFIIASSPIKQTSNSTKASHGQRLQPQLAFDIQQTNQQQPPRKGSKLDTDSRKSLKVIKKGQNDPSPQMTHGQGGTMQPGIGSPTNAQQALMNQSQNRQSDIARQQRIQVVAGRRRISGNEQQNQGQNNQNAQGFLGQPQILQHNQQMNIRRGFQRYQSDGQHNEPSGGAPDNQQQQPDNRAIQKPQISIAQHSMNTKRRSHYNDVLANDTHVVAGTMATTPQNSSLPQAQGIFAHQPMKYQAGKPNWTSDANMQIQMIGPPSPANHTSNSQPRGVQRRTPTNSVQNLANQRIHTSGAIGQGLISSTTPQNAFAQSQRNPQLNVIATNMINQQSLSQNGKRNLPHGIVGSLGQQHSNNTEALQDMRTTPRRDQWIMEGARPQSDGNANQMVIGQHSQANNARGGSVSAERTVGISKPVSHPNQAGVKPIRTVLKPPNGTFSPQNGSSKHLRRPK